MEEREQGRVLVIAPHPDDEVLGCGMAIQKHVAKGDRVAVVCLARRAYGHEYHHESEQVQQACARQAKEVLGYHDIIFFRLPDERMDHMVLNSIMPLEGVVADFKPDQVYVPHVGDMNQDHWAVHRACQVVLRPHQTGTMPVSVLAYEVPSSTDQAWKTGADSFRPTCYAVGHAELLRRKLLAMECYEQERRVHPHPRSPEGLETYARFRGMEVGREFAEAFMALRIVWD